MQYIITRAPDTSDELYHWKYIKRVKGKNGKWRYYYDFKDLLGYDERDVYKKAKKNYKKSKTDYEDAVLNSKLQTDKANLDGKVSKKEQKVIDKASSKVSLANKNKKKASKAYKKAMEKYSKTPVGLLNMVIPGKLDKAKKWISSKFTKDNKKQKKEKKDKEDKHKYIEKVKLPNGKYRYFYSKDEYESYLKRLTYQESEPEFMKDIPKISKNKIFTADQDMDKINETYSPYNDSTSQNCANCSVAYELRRRGYDVEAKANGGEEDYNGRLDRMYDYFENAKILNINEDGTTFAANEKFVRKACSKGYNWIDELKYKKDVVFDKSSQSYTAASMEKAIKKNNPPGSRGMIDVTWNAGGGHSLIYEVDKKGKVTIRDSQSYDSYSVDEIASQIKLARITRTDDLKLKKKILSAVTPNVDGDRKYQVDDWKLVYVK